MKKILIVAIMSVVLIAGVAADSFDGLTSVGINYEYRDGENMWGLSSQTFGYVGTCPVGYFVGVNADFAFSAVSDFAIGVIVGPSYRYMFQNVPMSIDVALGLSASGEWIDVNDFFGLGIGGYLGATYYMTDNIALMLGCTLGYDMLAVDLNTGDCSFYGNFYVSPSVAVGFRY